MKKVYLDHNATTPIHTKVSEAMLPFLSEHYGNPSSLHGFGRIVRAKIDEAREQVAKAISANASEIVFTSGGTESDNMAIIGVALANKSKGNHIVTTVIEHPAVLKACKYLEKNGFLVTYLPVDDFGMVNIEDVKNAINEKTVIVSIQHANNEVGTIQPIAEIAKTTKDKGVLFHTDAVQSLGKIPVNVKELGVDLLTISSHKIYGPKGIGALYIKNGVRNIEPLLHGGAHEKRRRGGTENVIGIVGFGAACEVLMAEYKLNAEKELKLRDSLFEFIKKNISRVKLNGHPIERLPNTLNVSFECVEGESLLINLDLEGIAISTGSACSSGSLEPSHVLVAMGIPLEIVHGSLRFSFGKENTTEDLSYVCEKLPPIIQKVRDMSPLWDD